ncbi:hypothetical protein ACP4OV_012234 [Aristida adscensionis]
MEVEARGSTLRMEKIIADLRSHRVALAAGTPIAAAGEEEGGVPAKKIKTAAEGSGAAAVETKSETETKKKAMRRIPPEEVARVLALKERPVRPPCPPSELPQLSEDRRLCHALYAEIIMSSNEYVRSVQEQYRRDLEDKGFVEVEAAADECDDDE